MKTRTELEVPPSHHHITLRPGCTVFCHCPSIGIEDNVPHIIKKGHCQASFNKLNQNLIKLLSQKGTASEIISSIFLLFKLISSNLIFLLLLHSLLLCETITSPYTHVEVPLRMSGSMNEISGILNAQHDSALGTHMHLPISALCFSLSLASSRMK